MASLAQGHWRDLLLGLGLGDGDVNKVPIKLLELEGLGQL